MLNLTALEHLRSIEPRAAALRVQSTTLACGARIYDFGINAAGGLSAGIELARLCLSNLAEVTIAAGNGRAGSGPAVITRTDQPLAACLGSQYAGWPVSVEKYFAMGSGPMRAARGKEDVLKELSLVEQPSEIVGVLETRALPDDDVAQHVADECGVKPNGVHLLVAPTASLAGTIQVVARSVETCLHKMHELGYPLNDIVSGFGSAPLPPIAKNDMTAIGWTNDAVLYGGEVTLWVNSSDENISELGPKIPSAASSDFGRPFAEIFRHYDHDFYKIDPLLFSPAQVVIHNLASGRTFEFGNVQRQILLESFHGSA